VASVPPPVPGVHAAMASIMVAAAVSRKPVCLSMIFRP
jgi:hypothetical protein